jgi:hypothetical protein
MWDLALVGACVSCVACVDDAHVGGCHALSEGAGGGVCHVLHSRLPSSGVRV